MTTNSSYVIYHANCVDGLTSASIHSLSNKNKNTIYIAGSYSKSFEDYPDFSNADVLFLDFSFKEKEFRLLLDIAKSVTVIDHHITAYHYLNNIVKEDNVFNNYIFNNDECGSTLTWKYVNPKLPLPLALEYIKDQDIYRWAYKEDSVPFCLYMETLSHDLKVYKDFWLNTFIHSSDIVKPSITIEKGKDLLILKQNYIDSIVKNYQVVNYLDLEIAFINCPSIFTNNVSDYFRDSPTDSYKYIVTYNIDEKGYYFSLRSSKGYSTLPITFSISSKDGGHENASGAFLTHEEFNKHPLKKLLTGIP